MHSVCCGKDMVTGRSGSGYCGGTFTPVPSSAPVPHCYVSVRGHLLSWRHAFFLHFVSVQLLFQGLDGQLKEFSSLPCVMSYCESGTVCTAGLSEGCLRQPHILSFLEQILFALQTAVLCLCGRRCMMHLACSRQLILCKLYTVTLLHCLWGGISAGCCALAAFVNGAYMLQLLGGICIPVPLL